MKVLVISDTHGNIENARYILDSAKAAGIKAVLHCGDYVSDARLIDKFYPEVEVYSVYGNCDVGFGGEYSMAVEIEGVTIYMTHGHRYGVKWGEYDELAIDAIAHDAKVAVCGHAHEAHLEIIDDVIVINPGSLTLPRDSKYPSYGILELEAGHVKEVKILQITDEGKIIHHPINNGFTIV